MLEAITFGFLWALFISISIGPIFFSLLEISINYGPYHAAVFIAGIALSDIIMVLTINTLLWDMIKQMMLYKPYLLLIGGSILIIVGVTKFIIGYNKMIPKDSTHITLTSSYSVSFVNGFFINSITPTVFLFWLTMATICSEMDFSSSGPLRNLFFYTIIFFVIIFDIIKALLSEKLKTFFSPTHIRLLNMSVAALLIVFGINLILSQYFYTP